MAQRLEVLPGQQLEWSSCGSGRVAAVLLHEGLGCVSLWRNFPQRLAAAAGCQVVSWSRAGYGRSDPCALPRPAVYMHDEARHTLPAALAHIDADRLVFVGHSDGASIATIYAGCREAGISDGRTAGLVLMAPHFFVEVQCLDEIRAAGDAFDRGELRSALARHHNNVDCAFRGWHDVWLSDEFRSWDIRAELDAVTVPILIIQGTGDRYGTPAQAAAARRAAVQWLPGCGHAPHREAPEATLDACTRFIQAAA